MKNYSLDCRGVELTNGTVLGKIDINEDDRDELLKILDRIEEKIDGVERKTPTRND